MRHFGAESDMILSFFDLSDLLFLQVIENMGLSVMA